MKISTKPQSIMPIMKKNIITISAMMLALSVQAQSFLNIDIADGETLQYYFKQSAEISFWGQSTPTEDNGDLYLTIEQLSDIEAKVKLNINREELFDDFGIYYSEKDYDVNSISEEWKNGKKNFIIFNRDKNKLLSSEDATYYVTPFCINGDEVIIGSKKSIKLKREVKEVAYMEIDIMMPNELITNIDGSVYENSEQKKYVFYNNPNNKTSLVGFSVPGPLLKGKKYKMDVTLMPSPLIDDYALQSKFRIVYGKSITNSRVHGEYMKDDNGDILIHGGSSPDSFSLEFTPSEDYFDPYLQFISYVSSKETVKYSNNFCFGKITISRIDGAVEKDNCVDLTKPCIEKDSNNKEYTANTSLKIVSNTNGENGDNNQKNFDSYVVFEPVQNSENISVAYELPIPLTKNKDYKLSVTMAPNNNSFKTYPAKFEMNYGQKGSPHRSKFKYDDYSDFFIHDAEIFETYELSLNPSEDMDNPVVQFNTNVANNEEDKFSRILSIAEISISENDDTTTIIRIKDNTSIDKSLSTGYYTLSGLKIQEMQKGINIVKMPDGTIKKVYVK